MVLQDAAGGLGPAEGAAAQPQEGPAGTAGRRQGLAAQIVRRFRLTQIADSGRLSQIEGKGVRRLGAALFQNGKLQAGPQRLEPAQLRQVGRRPKDPIAPQDGKPRREIDAGV